MSKDLIRRWLASVKSGGACVTSDERRSIATLLDEVDKLEKDKAKLREERRWISVEDLLPEHGYSVWVFDGTDVVLGEYWGTWQSYGSSCDREGVNSETLLGITHWTEIRQPLPPLPPGPEAAQ